MTFPTGIVTFDPAAFTKQYPCFANVPTPALDANFALAELALNNTRCSVVRNVNVRAQLLNLATAHYTALLNGIGADPANPTLVGRITSANQGSVSVSTEFKTDSESAAFWNQTSWGSMFWNLTLRFRTSRYLPPVCGGGFGWQTWGGGYPF